MRNRLKQKLAALVLELVGNMPISWGIRESPFSVSLGWSP